MSPKRLFYCLRRRPRRSEGEDLGAEGGGQVQTQDRLQGEAAGGLADVTRMDHCRGICSCLLLVNKSRGCRGDLFYHFNTVH